MFFFRAFPSFRQTPPSNSNFHSVTLLLHGRNNREEKYMRPLSFYSTIYFFKQKIFLTIFSPVKKEAEKLLKKHIFSLFLSRFYFSIPTIQDQKSRRGKRLGLNQRLVFICMHWNKMKCIKHANCFHSWCAVVKVSCFLFIDVPTFTVFTSFGLSCHSRKELKASPWVARIHSLIPDYQGKFPHHPCLGWLFHVLSSHCFASSHNHRHV